MLAPPFELGAVKLIVAAPLQEVIELIVGAEGVVALAAPYPIAVVTLSNSKPEPLKAIRVKNIFGSSNSRLI